MSRLKKQYILIAKNITYYGEEQLKWYQKPFYNPPRIHTGSKKIQSRRQAEMDTVPQYKQFGLIFPISTYEATTKKVIR